MRLQVACACYPLTEHQQQHEAATGRHDSRLQGFHSDNLSVLNLCHSVGERLPICCLANRPYSFFLCCLTEV